jgi:cytochrome c-type biogenesis protein CcmF
MIVELGLFALIVALLLATTQAWFGLAGAARRDPRWMAAVRPAVAGQWVFVATAFASLAWAFYRNDFSVLYVAENSNSGLPLFYRIAAVWGAHEGSLLLWALVLATWSLAVAAFSRQLPDTLAARVLGVLGVISIGFLSFILLTSNPFERLIPAAADGRDLNPLLQDFALTVHPPMLYTGYVGFSVAFSFAVAAMLEGRLDERWARWTRPWTTLAWLFLTVGIALGSWWAYYELGWGGWWFWDPVENASFMPWLAGTALLHSLAVTEKRGLFKSWTLLLAIIAFSLSLLGTFLVRSGVLVSVHAFANDPGRGLFILVFLSVCIGGSLALYAWRGPSLRTRGGFQAISRESFLVFNNVLLVVALALILIGTLYPLIIDALNLGKISVGPPYFNAVFLVPMLPLIALMAVGMHAGWKKARLTEVGRPLIVMLAIALAVGLVVPWLVWGSFQVLTAIGVTVAGWLVLSALYEPIQRLRRRQSLSRSVLGMSIAHLGIALTALGITVTQSYRIEKDIALSPGGSVDLRDYRFEFRSTRPIEGPNYRAVQSEVVVSRGGRTVTVLHPEKRVYRVQQSPMTEAGIDPAWNRDLFVAMGDELGQGAWSLRLQYKPLVRFIWLGALVMALGGLVAVTDRRYRTRRVSAEQPDRTTAGAGSGAVG